jgi:DNA-binding response OmpR family regulator
MQKILIIEDDKKLRHELEIFLNRNGLNSKCIETFENTIEDIINEKANLILLDINLPNYDGEYILKELRKTIDTPIIMVTSRDNEIDELISMNYGADNYVTKPFNSQILLAKINAILKRQNNSVDQDKINCGEFILNASKSIIQKDDKQAELTLNELKILKYLVKNKGKITSREDIMNYLWDTEDFIDDNTLTVNMTRLRGKLESIGVHDAIETKRGQGYIFTSQYI